VSALSDLIQLAKNNKEELQWQKQEKNSFSRDAMVTRSKNVRKTYPNTQTKYVGQKKKSNFDNLTLKRKRTNVIVTLTDSESESEKTIVTLTDFSDDGYKTDSFNGYES
jgi:predicted transport protein